MRNIVAKKIRAIAKFVASSENDSNVTNHRRRIMMEGGSNLSIDVDVRTLQETSSKFLCKKIKAVFRKVSTPDRYHFFRVLNDDVGLILKNATELAASKSPQPRPSMI